MRSLGVVVLLFAVACSSKAGAPPGPVEGGSPSDTGLPSSDSQVDRQGGVEAGAETAPMCQAKQLFQSCGKPSDCCAGLNCGNGAFCCIGRGLDDGSSCGYDEDCCSNHCQGGTVNGKCCSAASQACDFQSQCCTGFSCTSGHCCGDPQAVCATAADCCSGRTCGTISPPGGLNQDHRCCVEPSFGCSEDADCCGGARPTQCFNNVCCISITYPCTRDAECCDLSCVDGHCS